MESTRSKRKQIVQAAIDVFLKHGYAATSLQKVAEEAHVIRATIYSHFADKNELFKAIIEELTTNRMGEEFQQKMMEANVREFVYLMRDSIEQKKNDEQYLALLRIVIGESEKFPDLARLYFKTIHSKGMIVCQNYFQIRAGLGPEKALALTQVVVGSMMAHLIQQELLRGKEIVPMNLDDLADLLVQLLEPFSVE